MVLKLLQLILELRFVLGGDRLDFCEPVDHVESLSRLTSGACDHSAGHAPHPV